MTEGDAKEGDVDEEHINPTAKNDEYYESNVSNSFTIYQDSYEYINTSVRT